ncbi:MAG: T9SS type A sorting domain-containing protein [Bacteroidota bacterium]
MKNLYSTLFVLLFCWGSAQADLVITAVYDATLSGGTPKGVELYATNDIADLSLFGLGSANNGSGADTVEFTFPAVAVTAGTYLYVASDSTRFNEFFGFFPDYRSNAMGINGDDAIVLLQNGTVIDVFGDINTDGTDEPWEHADGWAVRKAGTGPDGSTFVLDNWRYSGPDALDGEQTNATAGNPIRIKTYDQAGILLPQYPIATVTSDAADGAADSLGVMCEIVGIVHGGDLRGGNGIQFTLIDDTGGIGVFDFNEVSAYAVAEGDRIRIEGEINQFNGLTQMNPDSIILLSAGNALATPMVVTELNASTESELIRINNVTIVDDTQWTNSGSGFNVDITDGTNTYSMRIDNDVDLYDKPAPVGVFDVIGIGGQFDNSNPFTEGYQIFPRAQADLFIQMPSTIEANDDFVTIDVNTPISIEMLNNDETPNGLESIEITRMPTQGMASVDDLLGVIDYVPNQDVCDVNDTIAYVICDNTPLCDTALIVISILCPSNYPLYDIATVTTNNTDGIPDSLDVVCEVRGVVYGVNLRPDDLQFTIIDRNDADAGMGIFSGNNNFGYTVNEGDEVAIRGTVSFFNGLTQMNPDTVILLSQGNSLFDPETITTQGESDESKLVRIDNVRLLDPGQWTNGGSGFNLDVTDGSNSYVIRIDRDVNIFGTTPPEGDFDVIGIGGQFDNSAPHDEGYQLLPRYQEDIIRQTPTEINAISDAVTTPINTPITIDVLANDQLPNGFTTVMIVDVLPSFGMATVVDDSLILYTPNMDVCGEVDQFVYEVCDMTGTCDSAIVEVTIECPISYPLYDIATVTTNDADGIPDSLGVSCEVRGIVYGGNLRGGGLQFTLIDANDADAGMGLFNLEGNFGYTVNEGDEVAVQGTVGFFNGLTQMNPDTVILLSENNSIFGPEDVSVLSETTESKLIRIPAVRIVDASEWTNGGTGFNVTVSNGSVEFEMRIDNDTEIFGTAPPTEAFNLIGIGGQFDNSAPHDAGYQILPRRLSDIDIISSAPNPLAEGAIRVYPNPTDTWLEITTDIPVARIELSNLLGQPLQVIAQPEASTQLDVSALSAGLYLLTFYGAEGKWTQQVIVR